MTHTKEKLIRATHSTTLKIYSYELLMHHLSKNGSTALRLFLLLMVFANIANTEACKHEQKGLINSSCE